jgi:drug/metabolite transporter (DMT)-like permease
MPTLILDAAALFALATAVFFALADLGMRYGLQHTNPFVGSMMWPFVAVITLLAVILPLGVAFPPYGEHYLWLAVAGTFSPGLFTIFFMLGIQRIGVARAAPIKGSAPLFAAILAVLILGERPEWYHLGGVLLVVAGIALVSSGRTEGGWRRIDALWPIAAAMCGATGAVFWRKGLPAFPDPVAGAFVGLLAAFVITFLYAFALMREQIPDGIRKAWKPFVLVGIVAAIGQICLANALQRGEVFRMIPLIQTSPLITVALALVLLRRVEFITWRVPAGALLTVGGAILVNLRLAH